MRSLSPDVLEVRLHHAYHDDRMHIEVWSRMYDIRLGLGLHHMWGDPRMLVDWIEHFIGGTVSSWYESRISPEAGREMAHALMPHWEREIHRQMERFEREWRYGSVRRYVGWDMAFDQPVEDQKAKKKARKILLRNLDDEQVKSFKKDGSFCVTAKDGKVYTISTARSFNVKAEDGTKYCGQLQDCPIEDQMLAQKLLLEHEPKKFFKNANVSPARQAMTATEILMRQEALRPGAINWISDRDFLP